MLWNFAMRRKDAPLQPNPMEFVVIRGASKRSKQPRSLTVEEFHRFSANLGEPFRTLPHVLRLSRPSNQRMSGLEMVGRGFGWGTPCGSSAVSWPTT